MQESKFNTLVDKTLSCLEEMLDISNDEGAAEIDYDTVGGILTLYFDNATQIIINRQTANQQLWVAAKSGGYHYEYEGKQWLNTQTKIPLWDDLQQFCSEQAGTKIQLTPPLCE